MALLLDIRRLDPMSELNTSESSANLTAYGPQEQPVSFRNPSFQDDLEQGDKWSPPSPTITIHLNNRTFSSGSPTNDNNNDCLLDDKNKSIAKALSPSDSGIIICIPSTPPLPNDDSSSVGGKSLDSGVYDAEANSGIRVSPTGDDRKEPKDNKNQKKSKKRKNSVKKHPAKDEESLLAICVQVFIPFLIAGTGTCGAGIVFDYVEGWEVFKTVSEIIILVPTLLGLKGNLEMTLASRVSTQANLKKFESLQEKWQMSWGNMALIQCQATVMGFLAACFAIVISITKDGFNIRHALVLTGSALFTASLASLVLGAITLLVVVLSHKCNINPDNVATPIAASLGDVTTLALLAVISNYLYQLKDDYLPACLTVGLFLLLVPVWCFLSYKNPFVKQVLYTGWIPVILAVIITSAGGYILELSVSQFKGLSIFQPVINGVAGNLVAVQASRISTYFHKNSERLGSYPPDGSNLCVSPCSAFFGGSVHARTARILMLMVIPGHILFGYAITAIKGGKTVLTINFLPIYLVSAFIQIAMLLYIAHCMIQILWRLKIDPDNSAIPLLTALGDLSGMICLAIAFIIYRNLFP